MVTIKETAMTARPNILLVHGAWADGSPWDAVIERLQADGYNVIAPQFPETSLAADVDRLPRYWTARTDPPCWPATPTAARS
jgi:pimeloyl-ACP methyl ester carboxylesterase